MTDDEMIDLADGCQAMLDRIEALEARNIEVERREDIHKDRLDNHADRLRTLENKDE